LRGLTQTGNSKEIQLEAENYIRDRVEQQIDWYNDKSSSAKCWFKILRTIEIIAAALIPLIAGFYKPEDQSLFIAATLGGIIAIIASLLSLCQFQENWIKYRTSCESLKHEKFLYLSKATPYEGESPFQTFVQRIESIISKENNAWAKNSQVGAEKSRPTQEK